jgi:hypothetical protein
MSDDIVERLRTFPVGFLADRPNPDTPAILKEAAAEIERLRAGRAAVVEECGAALDKKAALYRSYQERAARAGDLEKEALMQGHALTTEDDARAIRALKGGAASEAIISECQHKWSEWLLVGRHVERKCQKCGTEQYDD